MLSMRWLLVGLLVLVGVRVDAAPPSALALDAPLLFVKRHSYSGIHIYDTYYKWPPGGGGIYVLENPSAPREAWKIRAVVDDKTAGSPGFGVYTHPELSWDGKKLLFCFKGEPNGNTSIYEINVDGTGLKRITDPGPACAQHKGRLNGQHDIAPAYLPDGRIVFLSTRPSGLVPCNNTGVAILHVMNADGSGMRPISVNNVNEFDPSILPDGRILFGRWEYVDKNALTIQSLWTIHPDGTNESATYANNMVLPEAVLDARAVPGSHLIVGTLAKHNAVPRGSIAFIDPHGGKNDPAAITNLEHPENPTFDRGDSCEPWALSDQLVLYSGRPKGAKRNALQMINRAGEVTTLMSDPDICLHSPMLVKARPTPQVLSDATKPGANTGTFFVQDIYQDLAGVKRGEIKSLRVLEETSRVSPTHAGKQPYNQTFLVSAALAFSVKNVLGMVPVEEDGSAYFEAPSGRALYLQALDAEGRLVQSMRTFVQAAPGTTRSCIGCHEHKASAPSNDPGLKPALGRQPHKLRDESWGSGYLDFPSMVQPVLDKHCVSCHGGEKDIAAGIDLSGGWTEHFNIAYENLANRAKTQLTAHWISGIDCMNGTAYWSVQIFKARSHGSGNAPLAKLLVEGHGGYIKEMTRAERDLIMAWIDSNGLYHGTWDYADGGCAIDSWPAMKTKIVEQMKAAGCVKCHTGQRFENDWINLKEPRFSRILRAPLAKGAEGYGLGICRDHKARDQQRVRLLVKGYAHAIQPIEAYTVIERMLPDISGKEAASFASAGDANYAAFLRIIESARDTALKTPRVDMPGAVVHPGQCRQFVPTPLPDGLNMFTATRGPDGAVVLKWERSARTIGLEFEIHRGPAVGFAVSEKTLIATTTRFEAVDRTAAGGGDVYAIVMISDGKRSPPIYAN